MIIKTVRYILEKITIFYLVGAMSTLPLAIFELITVDEYLLIMLPALILGSIMWLDNELIIKKVRKLK